MATHYFITNREISNNPIKGSLKVNTLYVSDDEYIRTDGAEEAQDNLRYGKIEFDRKDVSKKISKLSKIEMKQIKLSLHPDLHRSNFDDPIKYEKEAEEYTFGSEKLFERLRKEGGERKDILLFIHGYNNDLRESLETLVQLDHYYVRRGSPIKHIVMFTWPSRKNILKYRDDARDAVKSGYALARAFLKLRKQFRELIKDNGEFCESKIHLMCHSMGGRVVESMMQQLEEMHIKPNNVFGEIFLMAADVDDDCMEANRPMHNLIALGERIHIYYNNKDKALGISERTKNAFNRLGKWGVRRTLQLPDDVYQADITYVEDQEAGIKNLFEKEELVNHWYYLKSKSVREDVLAVLNGEVTIFNY